MKVKAFLIVATLLFLSPTLFAGNGEMAFRKKIRNKIMYPLNLRQQVDATVYVEFTVLENATIQIDSISCEYDEICKEIAQQILSIEVDPKNQEIRNKTFVYKFKLEVEK